MKTFLIGALIFGLVTVGYAQGDNSISNLEIQLDNIKMAPINTNYLSKVKEGMVSTRILELQNSVASFNLSASALYKGKGRDYEVSFGKEDGKIYATYNDEGKILFSMGVFKDVIFPIPVRNTIYSTHPGWFVLSNTYKTFYSVEDGTENIYKVKIGKGMLQKRLRIDAEGNLL